MNGMNNRVKANIRVWAISYMLIKLTALHL